MMTTRLHQRIVTPVADFRAAVDRGFYACGRGRLARSSARGFCLIAAAITGSKHSQHDLSE